MRNVLVVVIALAAYAFGAASAKFDLFPYKQLAQRVSGQQAARVLPVSKVHGARGRELHERLMQGGYIIYFRHNDRAKIPDVNMVDALAHLTEPEIINPDYKEGLCLTEYGHRQSWYLERIFGLLALPIDKVIASPICRCVETAQGIFGRVDELDYDMVYKTILPPEEREAVFARRRATLETPPPAGKNTVIVAHSSGSLHDVGLMIPDLVEGGAVVLKPDGNGEIHFVAILKPRDWALMLARKPV